MVPLFFGNQVRRRAWRIGRLEARYLRGDNLAIRVALNRGNFADHRTVVAADLDANGGIQELLG